MKKEMKAIEKSIKNIKKEKKNEYVFGSGSTLLDLQIAGGEGLGYPIGRIINIVGDKSSGKTFVSCEAIANAYHRYKNKFKWNYDDCETGFTLNTKKLWNFEIMHDKTKKSRTVEELYCNVREFAESIKEDEKAIYVVDSLDGLSSDEGNKLADERYKAFKKGNKYDKGSYKMGKAKYLSQEFFEQLADLISKKNILLIIISQVRQNVNPFSFEEFTRNGGKALDFYCHSVIWLANISKIEKKERAIGVRIRTNNKKSKTPRPYRKTIITVFFTYGIDNTASNIDFLFDFLTPKGKLKENCKASWNNEEREENAETFIKFLKKEDLITKYVSKFGKKINMNTALNWINSKITLKKKYDKYMNESNGEVMTREQLIEYVENNNLQKELEKRTIDLWEKIEKSIVIKRKPKYA